MNSVTNDCLYYLVVQGRGEDAIPRFSLDQNLTRIMAAVMQLFQSLLSCAASAAAIWWGREVLRWGSRSLAGGREVCTVSGNSDDFGDGASWLGVSLKRYRICDCSEDYFMPWTPPSEEQATDCTSEGQTGLDVRDLTQRIDHHLPQPGAAVNNNLLSPVLVFQMCTRPSNPPVATRSVTT